MNARPAAAPMPERERGGMVQKIARAAVMSESAAVTTASDVQKPVTNSGATRAAAESRQATARLRILPPCRST